jgi:hypothetical protein
MGTERPSLYIFVVSVGYETKMSYQIFISLRFAEAGNEATTLKLALEEKGISTFLCAVHPGGDIAREIVNALHNCQLAIIMGTRTYGKDTGAGFSTFEELRFIHGQKKPFFLVKMCDRFEEPETVFRLDSSVSYFLWFPGSPIPGDLVTKILERLESTVSMGSEFMEKLRLPVPTSTMIPLESLGVTESVELLIHLGCSAEMRKRVKELNLVIDGSYLMYLQEFEVLQELEGVKNNLHIPVLKGILNKLKKFQETGIPLDVFSTLKKLNVPPVKYIESNQESFDKEEVSRVEPLQEQNRILAQASAKEVQARNYEKGHGVLVNPREASRLYGEAFQMYKTFVHYESPEALYHCGVMYLEGRGTEENQEEGKRLLLLACDKGYGLAEYRMHQLFKETNPVLSQQLLIRATLHDHEEAGASFKNVIQELNIGEATLQPYVKAILEFVVANYVDEGMKAIHSSWNRPDLLWKLYNEKASPNVFSFLQKRWPDYVEQARNTESKTILHRILEDWEDKHNEWFRQLFLLHLNGLDDPDIFDCTGRSLLDLCCSCNRLLPFHHLVRKNAQCLKLDQLDTVVTFFQDLKRLQKMEPNNEEISQALKDFKFLENRNLHFVWR